MEIHLSKPGGKREGPFTLEQINASLAQQQFRETDYWAWYEGLDSWVPLHQVPGVIEASEASPEVMAPEPLGEADGDTEIIARPSGGDGAQPLVISGLSSGMPAQALEHIFVFTDGEGQ